MLEINGLTKEYGNGVKALNDVNLSIGKGMFGLLGPNGAGKSSFMRTLATLQLPDSGQIRFNGIDVLQQPDELKKVLGYLPQEFGVYPRVSAYELLDYLAVLKGITNKSERKEQVLSLLAQTNLYQHKHNNVATFSGGMKRRFGIAQALLGSPQLIMVDEPTAGLDPEERNRFYNLLCEIGENTVLILSTHIIEDIQELCTNMAIINGGRVLKQGSPKALMQELDGKIWFKNIGHQEQVVEDNFSILSSKTVGANKVVYVHADQQPNEEYKSIYPTLEDAYFRALRIDGNTSASATVVTGG